MSETIEQTISTSMIEQQVKSVLAGKLNRPVSEIHLEDDLLIDLGLDSLSMAEMLVSVERAAGTHIPGDELLDANSVGDLVTLVSKHLLPQEV